MMSNQFNPNDRVVVKSGQHYNQHGKVIGPTTYGLFARVVTVALDESGKTEIPEGDLAHEKLKPQEVDAEVNKVKQHFNGVFPKLSEPMREQMKKEIPTHLGSLQDALTSKNKHRAGVESTYLQGIIPTISSTESILKDWGKDVEISL